jgi:hypothetical protein
MRGAIIPFLPCEERKFQVALHRDFSRRLHGLQADLDGMDRMYLNIRPEKLAEFWEGRAEMLHYKAALADLLLEMDGGE